MGLELDFLIKGRDEASGVLDKVTGKVNGLLDKFPNLTRNLVAGASAAYALSTAFSYVSEKTGELIKLAEEKEQADLRMAQAMKTNLLYTNESYKGMQEFAEQMKRTYAVEDETIERITAQLAPFGMTVAEIKKAIPVILDFAKAKDIDNESAANFLGKAYVGHVEMLQRMGIVLDQDRVKTQGLDYIIGEFNKRFGGAAQADIDSYSRKVREMGIAWDDVKKRVGTSLTQVLKPVVGSIAWFFEKLDSFEGKVASVRGSILDSVMGPSRRGPNMSNAQREDVEDRSGFGGSLLKERQNEDERAARDHEATMVSIDKMEKAAKEADLDEWGKKKADLEKQFEEEEKGLRAQGVKDFTEFNKKKTEILEAEHQKWIKSEQDTAKAAFDAWRDEDRTGLDEWEKQREDAAKKAQDIADQYKKAGLDATEVWRQFLNVIAEVNKQEDEKNWQQGYAALGKITAKRVANDEKADSVRDSLSGMAPLGNAAADAERQHELEEEKKYYLQLRALHASQNYLLEQDEELHMQAMARINDKYNNLILDDILKQTGIMLEAHEKQQEALINQKADADLKYLEKQKNRDDLTVEEQNKIADAIKAINDKRRDDLQKLQDEYHKTAQAAEDAGNSEEKAAGKGGSGGGGDSGSGGSQKAGMGDQWGSGDWGNTDFSSDFSLGSSSKGGTVGGGMGGGSVSMGGKPVVTGYAGVSTAGNANGGAVNESVQNYNGMINIWQFPNALVLTPNTAGEFVKQIAPFWEQMKAKYKI